MSCRKIKISDNSTEYKPKAQQASNIPDSLYKLLAFRLVRARPRLQPQDLAEAGLACRETRAHWRARHAGLSWIYTQPEGEVGPVAYCRTRFEGRAAQPLAAENLNPTPGVGFSSSSLPSGTRTALRIAAVDNVPDNLLCVG